MTREEKMKQILSELIPLYKGKIQDTISVSNVARTAFIKGWEAADAHPISPWISVEDRLPEKGERVVLGYCRGEIGWMLTEVDDMVLRKMKHKEQFGIKYWMPIPELPKGGAE